MLSKKMAFSLTSLIAILALAFVAPAAMAANFNVALAEHTDQPDIGAAPGLQVERPSDNNLKVNVMFGEFVKLATTNVSVSGFNMKGTYIPAVVVAKVDPADAANEFTLEITITAETSRVALMIAKGIASANAFSKNMSKALTADIYLYSPDVDITPKVYGIRRADRSALPLTGGAVNVIITLSEKPASFTAAHIDVTNATAGTPAKLNTIRQNAVGLTQFATHIDKPLLEALTVKEIRDGVTKPDVAVATDPGGSLDTILDADGAVVDGAMAGINHYLSAHMEANDTIPGGYLAEVIALRKKIGATAEDDIMYYHDNKDGVQQGAVTLTREISATAPAPGNNVMTMPIGDGGTYDKMIVPPSKQGTADLTETGAGIPTDGIAIVILSESFDRSKKAKDYTRPKVGDFTTVDDYNFAFRRYGLLTLDASTDNADNTSDQRAAYTKEKEIYDAYIALQKLIQEDRVKEITKRDEELIVAAREGTTTEIAENSLPPTGRDGMLHPYSVTLTPTYATASAVVVKVNRWQNMASDPGAYNPPTLETGYTENFNRLTIPVSASAVKKSTVASGVIRVIVNIDGAVF